LPFRKKQKGIRFGGDDVAVPDQTAPMTSRGQVAVATPNKAAVRDAWGETRAALTTQRSPTHE